MRSILVMYVSPLLLCWFAKRRSPLGRDPSAQALPPGGADQRPRLHHEEESQRHEPHAVQAEVDPDGGDRDGGLNGPERLLVVLPHGVHVRARAMPAYTATCISAVLSGVCDSAIAGEDHADKSRKCVRNLVVIGPNHGRSAVG